MKDNYFISANDCLNFQPVIKEQALLELLKTLYPEKDLPIDGTIILSIREGYTVKCSPSHDPIGFNYTFAGKKIMENKK